MFGLFKSKEIDPAILKEKVSDKIVEIWLNPILLPSHKFESFRSYVEIMGIKSFDPSNFSREKLRMTTSIAIGLLSKAAIPDSVVNEIISLVTKKASMHDRKMGEGLQDQAREYAHIRFSTNPREAGRHIEDRFSQQAFEFIPESDEVDRRYTLYKALSSFESDVIFQLSSAVRKSRI